MAKPQHLFRLYESGNLPSEGGYISTVMFDPEGSIYTIIELIRYANVKEINSDGDALTFRSDGYKTYLMVEPPNYLKRSVEPVFRDRGKAIPYRFGESEILSDYRNNRIIVGKKPIVSISSFTVDQPAGDNFSILFYNDEEIEKVMKNLLTTILNKDLGLPRTESRIAVNALCNPLLTSEQF